MSEFQTHNGETVTGERLQKALEEVAQDYEKLAEAIYKENAYASHVTEEVKLKERENWLKHAEEIRKGEIVTFSDWQRLNEKLTGECVGFFPELRGEK